MRGTYGVRQMSETQAWAYVGRTKSATKHHEANKVVCATVDKPQFQKENANEIAKWMRDGLTIERVPVEWVRLHLFTTTPYIAERTDHI